MRPAGPLGIGVMAAVLSSALGGTAIVATRYLAGAVDPLTIGAIRFLGGFAVLAAFAFGPGAGGNRLPPRPDWPAVTGLGLLFFGLFPLLFNASLIFTTAARGALALSTLPVLTLIAAVLFGVERFTARKATGVGLALVGAAAALGSGLSRSPDGAWRGDLLMVAAAVCMALYNVWSRPYVARAGALRMAASGMAVGGAMLGLAAALSGHPQAVLHLQAPGLVACLYLAIVCGALIFFLWAFALGRASPTRVAVTVGVNPIMASLMGAWLLDEPVRPNILAGLVAVLAGIVVASSSFRRASIGGVSYEP